MVIEMRTSATYILTEEETERNDRWMSILH